MDGHSPRKAPLSLVSGGLDEYLRERGEAETPLAEVVGQPSFDYRGLDELFAAWAAVPGIRSRAIGESADGRPIFACELGPADAGTISVILGGIHPIEWIGMEAALALAGLLASSPPTDRRVVFVPVVNVDGYSKVEQNLRRSRRRFVRGNSHGVDLNRNWPTHFKRRRAFALASWNRSGPSARSEPEVDAVCAHLDQLAAGSAIDVALSLHSIGKKILLPYGGVWAAPADMDRHRRAGEAIKKRLPRYKIKQVSHWVPGAFAHGMEIDHMHDEYGALAILIECTWGGASLWRPWQLGNPFRIFNPHPGRGEAARIANALEEIVRGVF